MPASRLFALLGLDGSAPAARRQQPSARPRRGASAGRKPLLTQAIMLVLHHPAAARAITDLDALRAVPARGVDVLVELIEAVMANPKLTTAQLVERWRERPEGARIAELAAAESLVPDRAAAERELSMGIQKLISAAGPGRRLDELIAASGERKLTAEEQQEFQALLGARQAPATNGD